MFGEKPKVTSLETRKQLLLLESDLNRAQFIEAVQDWKDEFHRTKEHLTRLGSMVSLAGKLAATFSTARQLFSRRLCQSIEVIEACGKHGITSDIELIAIDQINEAYERLLKQDVKYRFVIDMASLK